MSIHLKGMDALITWLKVEEEFCDKEIDKMKEVVSEIMETLFNINGSEE